MNFRKATKERRDELTSTCNNATANMDGTTTMNNKTAEVVVKQKKKKGGKKGRSYKPFSLIHK